MLAQVLEVPPLHFGLFLFGVGVALGLMFLVGYKLGATSAQVKLIEAMFEGFMSSTRSESDE